MANTGEMSFFHNEDKNETYEIVDAHARDLISHINSFDVAVVQVLPTTDISTHTIYFVPKNVPASQDNIYDEFINTDGTSAGWELIGDTQLDLSGYYTSSQTDALLNGKVDKISGMGLSTNDYTTGEKNKLSGIEARAEVNNVWFCVVDSYNKVDIAGGNSFRFDFYLSTISRSPRSISQQGDTRFKDGDVIIVSFNGVDTSQWRYLSPYYTVQFFIDEDAQTQNPHPYRVVIGDVSTSGELDYWGMYSIRTFIYKPKVENGTLQYSLIMAMSKAEGGFNDAYGEVTLSNSLTLNSDDVAASASAVKALKDLIDAGTGTQVQSDWTQSDSTAVDYIKHKPNLATVATSGSYGDLTNTPTIPSALSDLSDDSTHRVVTDTEKSTWSGKISDNPTFTEASTRANIASGESFATILGKIKKFFTDLKTVAFTGSYSDLSNTPNLANVATSGDYTDLTNKPTIPTVNDSTISFWYNQDSTQSFTLNQNSNKTINLNDHITTLVQGSNVEIVGNSYSYNSVEYTISATDTKPSNFGTQTSAQEATVSIGSDTNWHRIRQILGMTAGKLYLVEVSLMYPSATGGFRSIGISTSATTSSGYPDPTTSMGGNFFENVAPVSGAVTNITLTTFFTPASGETYYLCGRQNNSGGTSLAVTPRYRIIQLN